MRFAGREIGDGAKLANCGKGEKEKFGEKGRASPPPLGFGGFSDVLGNGGVYGGALESVGRALVSPGLGFDSEVPASEDRCVFTVAEWVAKIGVGGMGCDWITGFVDEVVALRLLFGWPFEYWERCDGTVCFGKLWGLPMTPLVMYMLLRCSMLKVARPSFMDSTAISINVMCEPSKTWPGYLSKKSSSWNTGAYRIGLLAND